MITTTFVYLTSTSSLPFPLTCYSFLFLCLCHHMFLNCAVSVIHAGHFFGCDQNEVSEAGALTCDVERNGQFVVLFEVPGNWWRISCTGLVLLPDCYRMIQAFPRSSLFRSVYSCYRAPGTIEQWPINAKHRFSHSLLKLVKRWHSREFGQMRQCAHDHIFSYTRCLIVRKQGRCTPSVTNSSSTNRTDFFDSAEKVKSWPKEQRRRTKWKEEERRPRGMSWPDVAIVRDAL